MFYKCDKDHQVISASSVFKGSVSTKAFRVKTDPFLKRPQRNTSDQMSTQESPGSLAKSGVGRINNPAYRGTVSFYRFLKEQTIKSCIEDRIVPVHEHEQKFDHEKNQFRGLLSTSQKRFRGEQIEFVGQKKMDSLDEYFQKQSSNVVLKTSPKRVQLRNNQLIYEQKQRDLQMMTIKNFKRGEQNYFEQLKRLHNEGLNSFVRKAQLRQKFYFDNLLPPSQQFINSKDLCLGRRAAPESTTEMLVSDNQWSSTDARAIETRINSMVDHSAQIHHILEDIKSKDQNDMKRSLPKEEREFQNHVVKCFRLNCVEEVKDILKADQSVLHYRDENGRTPHMIAAIRGYKQLVELLAQYKVDYSDTDSRGMTAKDLAKQADFEDIAQLLQALEKKQSYQPLQ